MSVDLNLVKCEVKVEHIAEEPEECFGEWEVPLYAQHEVKGELVLGPEQLQPQDVAFVRPDKAEPSIEESSVSETSHIQHLTPQAPIAPEPSPGALLDSQAGLKIQSSRLARHQTTQKTNLINDTQTKRANNHVIDSSESHKYNLLPKLSREKYLKVYDNFITWKSQQNANSISENLLIVYFNELTKTLQPTTLWVIYSMLKATLDTKHNINIKHYTKLTALLKRLAEGYKPQKSRVLTADNIETFLREAPDEKYLAIKVILIFGINGACRAVEMTDIKTSYLEDHHEMILVNLPTTKTGIDRAFVIRNELLNIVRKYQQLRPQNIKHDRFFLNYFKGKCTRQAIGRHKLATAPKTIASFLKLPNAESYTGTCFRRTSATILADAGANLLALKRHGGWKSSKVAQTYIGDSVKNKCEINNGVTEAVVSASTLIAAPSTSEMTPSTSFEEVAKHSLAAELSHTETQPQLFDEDSSISKTSSNEENSAIQVSVKHEPLNGVLVDSQPAFSADTEPLRDPLSLEHPTHNMPDTCMEVETDNDKLKTIGRVPSHETDTNDSTACVYNLLPEKSRDKYFRVYNNFVSWKTEEKTISESVLLEYFNELSSVRQPSTLWAIFSMLKATIHSEHNINIKHYKKLLTLLKRLSAGYKPKRSKVLTAENVERFIREAPDEIYLAIKVVLIFGINGACRASELTAIKTSYLQNHNDMLLVTLPKTKADRAFVIRDEFLNIVRKYQMLRPANVGHDRLFLKYGQGRCTKQPMGRHALAAAPRAIAGFLRLAGAARYAGHCLRRTAASLRAKANGTLKRQSSKVAESYIKDSIEIKVQESSEASPPIRTVPSEMSPPKPLPSLPAVSSDSLPTSEQTNVNSGSEAAATPALAKILPPKSAEKYLRSFEQFMAWREKRRTKTFSENLILAYFIDLAKERKPTSLWATYSMLKNTIKLKHNIDIKSYTSLLTFLKRQSAGFKSKKSRTFTEENITTFLNEAPDDAFLATKVALILGVTGACRTRELTNLTINNVTCREDIISVKICDFKTKVNRTFVVGRELAPFIKKYQALRPSTVKFDRFFINYKNGQCYSQVTGRHKMAAMPAEVASYLKLPNSKCYTGLCFRRSSVTLSANSKATH